MYGKVSEWLRENLEGTDDLGENYVVSWAMCDIDTHIKLNEAKYGEEIADWDREQRDEGATLVVRALVVTEGIELVDGDDFYFKVDENFDLELINEPDRPALCGSELDEGMRWVSERAGKYA